MPKAKVGDIHIYYEVHGNGEPLINICGSGVNVEWMRNIIPIYSSEYKLVLFDNRGAGLSDAPDIPYSTEMMADDVAGLMDAIGIEKAHVWGGSMGGMIAQQFALRYPERVKSLVLACTYCGGPGSSFMTDPETQRVMSIIPTLPPDQIWKEFLHCFVSQQFINNNPELIKKTLESMNKNPGTVHGQIHQSQAVAKHNTYDRLSEIKASTLVIAGDGDKIIPCENSKIIASKISNAKLVILKDTGHMFLESEKEQHRIIMEFLKKHSKKSGQ